MSNLIEKFPVPLIFKKILKDSLTGELELLHEKYSKQLYFVKGQLAFATTTVDSERLGEVLLSLHKITPEQFNTMSRVKSNGDSTRKVGEILMEVSGLNKQDIYYTLSYQIKKIAAATFGMTDGEWRFTVKQPLIPNTHQFHIKIAEIVLEGVGQIRDISYFKRRYSLRAPVTTTLPEEIQKYLTTEQMKFYFKLSNFSNEPVTSIIPKMDILQELFWKNIIHLYLLNVVDFVEYTIDEEVNKNIEEIAELHSKIKKQELNFYQVLGIANGTDKEKIKESYFNFSRKYHPDRINAAPDSTVKLQANEVFAEINRAYEILSNEEKRREYDAHQYKEMTTTDTEQSHQTKTGRNLYLKANSLYKQKRYYEAATMMEETVKRDSTKASYFLLLGLCHSKLPASKNRAEQCLKKATELEPWNADHLFALGELYKSENLMKKAQVAFNRALEINLEHTLAGKAKEELEKMFSPHKKNFFSLFGKKK